MAYTKPTLVGYNSNPPTDDGEQTAANRVDWAKHLEKIGNPLRIYADAINNRVADALANSPEQYPSIAALTGISNPADGQVVLVTAEGRGGLFEFDASLTGDADNGVTFKADDATTGSWIRRYSGPVDIRWFGAVGDGVVSLGNAATGTDNYAAIAAALEYESVYIPSGVFCFDSPITITTSGKTIIGDGRANSILVFRGAADTTAITIGETPGTNIERILFRDFALRIGSLNDCDGILLRACVRSQFSRIDIWGGKHPATQTLVGSGLRMFGSVFLNAFESVDVRLFAVGVDVDQEAAPWYSGDCVFYGQGELQNNTIGMKIGNGAVTGTGGGLVSVCDYTIEGNYTGGVLAAGGLTGVHLDKIWFEANGDYDVKIGASADVDSIRNFTLSRSFLTSQGTQIKVHIEKVIFAKFSENRISPSTTLADPEGFYVPATNDAERLVFKDNVVSSAADYNVDDATSYLIEDPWRGFANEAVTTNGFEAAHKFNQGTQIVTKRLTGTTDITASAGGIFTSADFVITDFVGDDFLTFEYAFQSVNIFRASAPCWVISQSSSTTQNAVRFRLGAGESSASVAYIIDVILIGRWK